MEVQEIKNGLLSLEPSHPFYQALLAWLAEHRNSEVSAVTASNLTDAARHFNAGRLAMLEDVLTALPEDLAAWREEQARAAAKAEKV